MAADAGAIGRWAAAHAATITRPAAGTAPEPADASTRGLPREPVPAVLAAFTEIRTLQDPSESINRLAWARHPDGRLLLATCSGDGKIRIWDADTSQQVRTLTGHGGAIGRAEWEHARDGRLLLATGAHDGTARIWDPDTGECLQALTAHYGAVAIAWGTSLGGQPALATRDQAGATRIWDIGTGREQSALASGRGDRDSGPRPSWSDSITWATGIDGQARLATSDYSGGTLRVWDSGTGQDLYASPANETRHSYSIMYARRADGQLALASADSDAVRIWTEANGEFISEPLPGTRGDTYAVSWAPLADDRLLLATATGNAVHLWDGHTLQKLHTVEFDFSFTEGGTGRLDWHQTPDGQLLLANAATYGLIHIWEAVLDPPARPPAAGARYSPASAPAVPSQPGPARLVLPPREVTPQFPEATRIQEKTDSLACVMTPDGRTVLATTHSGANDALVWDLESGRHLRALTGHSDGVRDVAWALARDGRLLLATAGRDSAARIWDPDTGHTIHTLTGHNEHVEAVAWGTHPDGTLLLATAGYDGTARIWDPETGNTIHTLTGHTSYVWAVAWGVRPDGSLLLATGSGDSTARIWDPETGQELRTVIGHTAAIEAVAWATLPDGTMLLATAGYDGTARIWDPDTGQELHVLTGSSQEDDPGQQGDDIYAAAWAQASDGRLLLATASDTGSARIWDPATGAELASLPGTGSQWRSAAWVRDGEGNLLLVLASPDPGSGPVRAWLVETGARGQAGPQQPGRPGTRRGAEAGGQLLRLGAGGLWLPLGLLADLVTLTGTGDTGRPRACMMPDWARWLAGRGSPGWPAWPRASRAGTPTRGPRSLPCSPPAWASPPGTPRPATPSRQNSATPSTRRSRPGPAPAFPRKRGRGAPLSPTCGRLPPRSMTR